MHTLLGALLPNPVSWRSSNVNVAGLHTSTTAAAMAPRRHATLLAKRREVICEVGRPLRYRLHLASRTYKFGVVYAVHLELAVVQASRHR
jgi:hypothetical protein